MEEERRKGVKERKEREMAGSSDGRSEWWRGRKRVLSKKGSREYVGKEEQCIRIVQLHHRKEGGREGGR